MRVRSAYMIFIVTFFIFSINSFYLKQAEAESNETGDYLAAEDWDIGTPPANWPYCRGSSWHSWVPKNYDCNWGEGELSTAIKYSGSRSFHDTRPAGDPGSMSISYNFTPQSSVYLRMYLYFGPSFQNSNVNGAEDIIHFLFFNSAVSFTGFGVDLRVYSDQYHQWPPTCSEQERSLYFTFHTSHNCSGGEDAYGASNANNCWNILDHLEEWICWEIMWDLPGKNAKMWINENLIIDRQICSTNHSEISKVILSLWNSTTTSFKHDVYIDNIIISNNYIGPVGVPTIPPAPDTIDPTVTITQPTLGATCSTDQSTITLGGTASDNVGVTSVTWKNDRGGDDTASGTTSLTISNISLQEGDNVITVTAHDAAGNTSADTLTVTCTYTPPSGDYTKEFGSATGADYPGTLEDTFININEEKAFASEYLHTYTWPQDKAANAIIMKWDLSAIPNSATIQDATLYLYLSSAGGDNLYDLTVHKIINYNPVISACTGYTYNGTNSWTPNTQCNNNVPLAQADIAAAEDARSIDKTYGYKSWSVTSMVQDWVSNQGSNYGMLVNSDPVASSDSNRFFSATEYENSDQRPKLVVTYTVGDISAPQGLDVIAP